MDNNDSQDIIGTITDKHDGYDSVSWRLLSSASKKMDCYLDRASNLDPPFTKELMEFLVGSPKRKEMQIRIITKIDKGNLSACKHLMNYSEVYHFDGLDGSFYIIDDTAYLYEVEENLVNQKHTRRLLYSTYPQFVKLQQQLFESLLSRALPARDKLKEIEKGTESEFIETIRDPSKALQLAKQIVGSASFEILLLFSTINSFYRAEKEGLLELLGDASSHGTSVRVLVKTEDEAIREVSKQKIKQKHERINVSFIERSVRSKTTTIIVDQTFSLVMEVGDDSKDEFSAATGLSTYSNSESTVFTYYSLFENLWIQAEYERQGKVRQAYFRMFKGQKLKDEVYSKKWDADGKSRVS